MAKKLTLLAVALLLWLAGRAWLDRQESAYLLEQKRQQQEG